MKYTMIAIALIMMSEISIAAEKEKYNRKQILSYIHVDGGTTGEPVIQSQALGGAMASYNTLMNVDQVLEQNKKIINQNEEILKLLKNR